MKSNMFCVVYCLGSVVCAMEKGEHVTLDTPMQEVTGVVRQREDGYEQTAEPSPACVVRKSHMATCVSGEGSLGGDALLDGLRQFSDLCRVHHFGEAFVRRGVCEFFARALQENNWAVFSALIAAGSPYAQYLGRSQMELLCYQMKGRQFRGYDSLLRVAEQWLCAHPRAEYSNEWCLLPQWAESGR